MAEEAQRGGIGSRRIVVGVDDSAESHAALRWAAAEAVLRGAELWMVHAYSYPVSITWHTVPVLARPECCDRAAEEMLARIELDQLGGHAGVTVRRVALPGVPADALVDLSEGSELLVVGGRTHPSVLGAVLGSVGRAVERYAHCPVVVVHVTDVRPEEGNGGVEIFRAAS